MLHYLLYQYTKNKTHFPVLYRVNLPWFLPSCDPLAFKILGYAECCYSVCFVNTITVSGTKNAATVDNGCCSDSDNVGSMMIVMIMTMIIFLKV